jgi:hypothetical protein
MKKLDIPISPETSRDITPKEKWISQHTWTSSEEEVDMEIDDTADTTTGPSSYGWPAWDAWGAPPSPGPSFSGWDA